MADHSIVHVELTSSNPKAAAKFFSEVFGWKTELIEAFNYTSFQPQSGMGGAFPQSDEHRGPGVAIVYIHTDDIDDSIAKIEAAGGQIMMPKMEIPGTGWIALFTDPTGVMAGLFTGGMISESR
ncbi:MAG: VOC family protein [Chloroflexi bacterium]|nr:VOC family protein [Chloroflexota bacterium]